MHYTENELLEEIKKRTGVDLKDDSQFTEFIFGQVEDEALDFREKSSFNQNKLLAMVREVNKRKGLFLSPEIPQSKKFPSPKEKEIDTKWLIHNRLLSKELEPLACFYRERYLGLSEPLKDEEVGKWLYEAMLEEKKTKPMQEGLLLSPPGKYSGGDFWGGEVWDFLKKEEKAQGIIIPPDIWCDLVTVINFYIPGKGWSSKIPDEHGKLGSLKEQAQHLIGLTGWDESEAMVFILTGKTPNWPGWRGSIKNYGSFIGYPFRLVLEIDPRLSPSEVAKAYQKMSQRDLLEPFSRRKFKKSTLNLIEFVLNSPNITWEERRKQWNKIFLNWRINDTRIMKNTYIRAKRILLKGGTSKENIKKKGDKT